MSALLRTDRLWDLSQPIVHDGPAWAKYDPPFVSRNYRRAAEGFNAETLRLNTHTGTHVDVPFHFDDRGATIERVPLAAFAAPALFLDLRDHVRAGQPIEPEHLDACTDALEDGDIAVLVTGWGADRGVAGVGIDALSIGGWGGPERGEPSHLALLGAGKIIVEELHVPDELAGRRCFLTAFPVLLEGCGGAWTRAVAWELDE